MPTSTTHDHTPLETYPRQNSDGENELVLYNPNAQHEWINASARDTVTLEEER